MHFIHLAAFCTSPLWYPIGTTSATCPKLALSGPRNLLNLLYFLSCEILCCLPSHIRNLWITLISPSPLHPWLGIKLCLFYLHTISRPFFLVPPRHHCLRLGLCISFWSSTCILPKLQPQGKKMTFLARRGFFLIVPSFARISNLALLVKAAKVHVQFVPVLEISEKRHRGRWLMST